MKRFINLMNANYLQKYITSIHLNIYQHASVFRILKDILNFDSFEFQSSKIITRWDTYVAKIFTFFLLFILENKNLQLF